MDGIIFPVTISLLMSIGLVLSTFLFVSLKQEVSSLKRDHAEVERSAKESASKLRTEIEALKESISEIEQRAGELPQLSAPIPSMNTTRRSQVLRMHRRGERPEQISAALGLPRGEVELLLKFHAVGGAA
jgi:hypothetical protein